ncbi:MAG: hypothetical protein LAP40_23655 [Acidobacteriia bacterium]|nr:hypothetical protein [Terriglobia bacterium]
MQFENDGCAPEGLVAALPLHRAEGRSVVSMGTTMRLALLYVLAMGAVAADRPASLFVDRGACPFECCTYRKWKASKPLVLRNRPGGKAVGGLKPGDWVSALTGETRSVPLAMASPVDVPDEGIRKGDPIFLLHYEGEGFWKIWVRGKTADVEVLSVRQVPKTEWWAKVRTSGGLIGWVRAEGNFENQDGCG